MSIIGRDADRLKLAYDEISKACRDRANQKIECLSLDVSRDMLQVQQSLQELEERLGTCYMLVNSAGYSVCGKVEDTAELNLRRLLEINLAGTFFCTKAVVPSMKIARQGKIVLVGSQASLLGETPLVIIITFLPLLPELTATLHSLACSWPKTRGIRCYGPIVS